MGLANRLLGCLVIVASLVATNPLARADALADGPAKVKVLPVIPLPARAFAIPRLRPWSRKRLPRVSMIWSVSARLSTAARMVPWR